MSTPVQRPWWLEPEQVGLWDQWYAVNEGVRTGKHSGAQMLELSNRLIKANPAFLLHNYTKIQDKNAELIPFNAWTPAQVRVYRTVRNLQRMGRPVRLIILKARQTGISTLIEGLGYHKTSYSENICTLIAAQEVEAVERIFEMFRVYYASTPEPLQTETNKFTLEEIRFGKKDRKQLGTASRILTKTLALGGARKSEAGKGRGGTYHFFHGSECAFWPMAARFMRGIEPGFPLTAASMAFLESTANGTGNWFHKRWKRASEGWRLVKQESGPPLWYNDSGRWGLWIPVFLSRLEHPEYSLALPNRASEPGFEKERAYYEKHNLDEYDRKCVDEYGATLEQVEWFKFTLAESFEDDLQGMLQENPMTPHEAFITSGSKVFDLAAAAYYRERAASFTPKDFDTGRLARDDKLRLIMEDDPQGPLKVFKRPKPGKMYAIGVDPCEGRNNNEGDYSVACVLDTETWEQVAIFRERIDPDELAEAINDLGGWYNNAMLVIEVNTGATVDWLMGKTYQYWNRYRRIEYDSFTGQRVAKWGWNTNSKSRSMMVNSLKSHWRKRLLILNDAVTIEEFCDWEKKKDYKGSIKEAPADYDGHDDCVIATGLALQGGVLDTPRDDDETELTADEIQLRAVNVSPSERKKASIRERIESRRNADDPTGMNDW